MAATAKKDGTTGKVSLSKIEKTLLEFAKANLNVMLIGDHGVGKTTILRFIAETLNLKLKYYSGSTLDPFADLVGVPFPQKGDGETTPHLLFVRPREIDAAEIIFVDELNRSHPKIQNAVLEMTQFHTINGEPLPNLKMVWAAVNPPEQIYTGVVNLDPALWDRFHAHVTIEADPNKKYYVEKCGIQPGTVDTLIKWWGQLNAEQKRQITPRRLEYMGRMHDQGLNIEFTVPYGVNVPVNSLIQMLTVKKDDILTEYDMDMALNPDAQGVAKKTEIIEKMAKNETYQVQVCKVIATKRSTWPNVVKFLDFVKAMGAECQEDFFTRIEWAIKRGVFSEKSANFKAMGQLAGPAKEFIDLAKKNGVTWDENK